MPYTAKQVAAAHEAVERPEKSTSGMPPAFAKRMIGEMHGEKVKPKRAKVKRKKA